MPERAATSIHLAPAAARVTEIQGGYELSSTLPLADYDSHLGLALERAARLHPDRAFLAERASASTPWRSLAYGEARDAVSRLAVGLSSLGLSTSRPLMLLSGNGIEHALLTLAAMHVGIPAVPISTAYSLISSDFARLRSIVGRIRPGAVFVDDPERYARALDAVDWGDAVVIAGASAKPPVGGTTVADLERVDSSTVLEAAAATVGPDTVAKILFTSGSTSEPKGVLNTHRMLCSNQTATAQLLPFIAEQAEHGSPPIVCDWLPWNHTFGANSNFNLVLHHAGTLYIDGGKPTPEGLDLTVANLADVAPTVYFNVPRGYAMLADALERDADAGARFFSRMRMLFYAGAALSEATWQRLQALATRFTGAPIPLLTGWGATETAPAATMLHWHEPSSGNIGLPLPGTTIRLVLQAGKHELRVRGPNVTPGYFDDEAATEAAFDADGFYRTGDAGALVDPERPALGIRFLGRVAEDFKLDTGTWVHAGRLRLAAVSALSPYVADCVVTGHDRSELGLLLFLDLPACRHACGHADAPADALASNPMLREKLAAGLARHNELHGSSSTRFARALVLVEPPSIDDGELTDKGYLNQRRVLERRGGDVARLYLDDPSVVLPARH